MSHKEKVAGSKKSKNKHTSSVGQDPIHRFFAPYTSPSPIASLVASARRIVAIIVLYYPTHSPPPNRANYTTLL